MAAASLSAIRDVLPLGGTLDDEAFASRHQGLRWLLGMHVPGLLAVGVARGYGVLQSVVAALLPLVCLWCAARARRRLAACFVTAGLLLSSSVLVQLSGGAVEAHFHFFVVLGFVALYQSWLPLLVAAAVVGPTVAGTGERPGTWVAIHGVAVLAAFAGQIASWRATEQEQRRSARLAAELARTQTQVEARESVSELFVNLARRNQGLLDRQINLIVAMQEREADPDQLAELFQLDHLATRIRRNAESLLVLSGEEPARRWGRPVALNEVVRAAIAEVEDYRRTDAAVDESVAVVGRAVADLAHLFAELVENGLQFSSPDCRVRVASSLRPDGGCTLTVEDRGIGLPDLDLMSANDLLARAPEVDLRLSKRLGFHVVSRLAARYQVRVSLAPTPGGGTTATVVLPAEVLAPVEPALTALPPTRPRARARPPMAAVPTVAGRVLSGIGDVPVRVPEPIGPQFEVVAAGPLPRRVPQASINPQILSGAGPAPVAAGTPVEGTRRSADEVRAVLARFQAGQERGRQEAQGR